MIVAVADTHAVIWYLFSDQRLGKAASAFIDDTIAKGTIYRGLFHQPCRDGLPC